MLKNHKIQLNFALSFLVLVCSFFVATARTEAATISVSAGTDTKVTDSVCRLSEAIENINNQAQTHADCAAGTGNDVIQLPTGTIALSADLPMLTRSITIQGSGTDRSIINGGGQYFVFRFNAPTGGFVFKDLKVRSFGGSAIMGQDAKSIDIKNIEADGNGSISKDMGDGTTFIGGFAFISSGVEPPQISIDDFYAHDFVSSDAVFMAGVAVMGPNNKMQTVIGRNITISNLVSTTPNGQLIGVFSTAGLGGGSRSMAGTYENITVENIESMNGANVSAFALSGVIGGGDSTGNITLRNATIRNITTGPSPYASGAVSVVGGASGPGEHFEGSIKLQNVVIANVSVGGTSKSCSKNDISTSLGGQGSASLSIESLGGNISDDKSCNAYFKHATDKTNQTKLKDTLGKLSNNGGVVPTIPLLAGSLAIDAGICEDAPAKDARGISRPQGVTCDSGAFEVQQASLSSPEGSPDPVTGKKIFIDAPIPGSVVNSASIIPATEAEADSSHEYPLGLVGFTVEGIPSGSTQTMNLYFETDAKAEEFVARKYNQSTKEYRDIPGAVLSNETRNGRPVIKLSYQITDGGELDLDGAADGSLLDPVGLAKPKSLLASTGTTTIVTSLVAAVLIVAVILVNIDYRRHKAPLIELDKQTHQNLAANYTFWHHVKVVTIPTMKYRFTIVLDKKTTI